MTKEKATSPEKKAALAAIKAEFKGTDSETQRTRIMETLRRVGAVTTYEARRYLDIYFPPARVKELRDQGERIATYWQQITTETGDLHGADLYVLESGVHYEADR
jgi:hypothetical protein